MQSITTLMVSEFSALRTKKMIKRDRKGKVAVRYEMKGDSIVYFSRVPALQLIICPFQNIQKKYN